MHCRNVHNARASNVFIPRSVCGEFAAGIVGAAVEGAVFAVSEDMPPHRGHLPEATAMLRLSSYERTLRMCSLRLSFESGMFDSISLL